MIQLMNEVRQAAAELREELERYKSYRAQLQHNNQQQKQNINNVK